MSLREKAPWHFWLVGGLAVLWNGFGAVQWYLKSTMNMAFWGGLTMQQATFLQQTPFWANTAYNVAIATALIASVMLLFRHRLAYRLFAASLIAMLINTAYVQLLGDGYAVFGLIGLLCTLGLIAIAAGEVAYSRYAHVKGIIR